MNFNSFYRSDDHTKRNIIIAICVVVIIAVVVCIITVNKGKKTEEPIVDNTPTNEDSNFIPFENNTVLEQTDVVSVSKATIIEVSDLSTMCMLKVSIGVGELASEVMVEADIDTTFFDLNSKGTISPNMLKEGDKIILYSSGNSNLGNIKAHFVGVGDDTSYSYGVLKSVKGTQADGFECELEDVIDTLRVNQDTKIISGYLNSSSIPSMSVVKEGSKLLYKYVPEFEITAKGNVYTCTEIIVFTQN